MVSQIQLRIAHLLAVLHRDERGASMVEYGLLVALIAIVAIVGVTAVGQALLALFNNVAGQINP